MNFLKFKGRGKARGAAAFVSLLALLSNTFAVGVAGAQEQRKQQRAAQALREDERIVHVLNRLGFGPRPGDVERVRRMGLERYIEEQLQPQGIRDEAVEAKLRALPTLTMSSSELLAKYPNPGQLLRRLQREGELPPELAALRDAQQKALETQARGGGTKSVAPVAPDANENEMSATMTDKPSADAEANAGAADAGDRRESRRAMLEYMRERGLQPPQRILAELQASRILRAVYSERQLQEVLVDFWTNHFNIFAGKGADRWLLTSYDRDVIRPHALGKFRDLLEATAKSPAMLFYLDNFQSVSPNARMPGGNERRRRLQMMNPSTRERLRRQAGGGFGRLRRQNPEQMRQQQPEGAGAAQMNAQQAPPQQQRRRRGINENYARELMELHTLGVDGGYTQRDVQEVARAFTGWTILNPRGYMGDETAAQFHFSPRLHDDGEKTVLGQKIPARGGIRDGQLVLDILARHPATARFIAAKLSRRFVSDNPSPALVARVADAFTKSDGDIRATLRALFASPEFNSAEARRAKIKTPFELAVSAIRTLGGDTNGSPQLHRWIAKMGEPLYLYQAPTGYPDRADAWVNTGALLERLNFALALVGNRIPGTRVDLSRFVGRAANASGRVAGQEFVIDEFLKLIVQGDVSPKTKATLLKQLAEPLDANAGAELSDSSDDRATKRNGMPSRRAQTSKGTTTATAAVGNPEVSRIAALILGTPEFQRQ
ncbi:MAG TPA: DUF1800 domain-containing protein [Pyrinomonadaceae bacterium]|jgi:uncharacterized protein (DUF1800 family)|nr:DUF1800 domain-containing protein [Pyrinomonadaceae bacterium]